MAALTLMELAKLGGEELLEMARAGDLRPRHLWVAAKGAERYRKAVAAGDIASDGEQDRRAGKCAGCRLTTWSKVVGGGMDQVEKGWCGTALDEHQASGACGCLVALRINGQIVPGAKVAVESDCCPIGEW